jgi:hypothetical protein
MLVRNLGLEVNAKEVRCILMYQQSVGLSHNMKEVKNKENLGNALYSSVYSILSSHLQCKNLKLNYIKPNLFVVLFVYEAWFYN